MSQIVRDSFLRFGFSLHVYTALLSLKIWSRAPPWGGSGVGKVIIISNPTTVEAVLSCGWGFDKIYFVSLFTQFVCTLFDKQSANN